MTQFKNVSGTPLDIPILGVHVEIDESFEVPDELVTAFAHQTANFASDDPTVQDLLKAQQAIPAQVAASTPSPSVPAAAVETAPEAPAVTPNVAPPAEPAPVEPTPTTAPAPEPAAAEQPAAPAAAADTTTPNGATA